MFEIRRWYTWQINKKATILVSGMSLSLSLSACTVSSDRQGKSIQLGSRLDTCIISDGRLRTTAQQSAGTAVG